MSKFIVLFVTSVCIISFTGCAGSCIKVGGTYESIGGNIQYCWNQQATDDSGVPAFEETCTTGDCEKNDESKTLFGFDLDTINKLKNSLKGMVGMSAQKVRVENQRHPARELMDILEDIEFKKTKE